MKSVGFCQSTRFAAFAVVSGVFMMCAALPGWAQAGKPSTPVTVENPSTSPVPTAIVNPSTSPVPTAIVNPSSNPVPTAIVNPTASPVPTTDVN